MSQPLNEWGIPVGSSLDRDTWPDRLQRRLCDSPMPFHRPSERAEAARVDRTRCIGCRKAIRIESDREWRTYA